jgi:hypothetical protein
MNGLGSDLIDGSGTINPAALNTAGKSLPSIPILHLLLRSRLGYCYHPFRVAEERFEDALLNLIAHSTWRINANDRDQSRFHHQLSVPLPLPTVTTTIATRAPEASSEVAQRISMGIKI